MGKILNYIQRKIDQLYNFALRYKPEIILTSLILLFLIVYLSPGIFIMINAGEAGVLFKRFAEGTVVDKVYPEGFHTIFPWDKMTVYDVRYQQLPHELDVLTDRGLRISLNLSIRYHPEYDLLGVLHKKVGPDYVNKIVIPEVDNTLRTIIGQYSAEYIYTQGAGVLQQAVNEAFEQVSERFVAIDDVIIQKITLPPAVETAIQNKIEQEQLAMAHDFKIELAKKEALRKEIEAGGLKAYNDIVASSLNDQILAWQGIQATLELSASQNAKVVVIGSGKDGLPIILGPTP